MYTSESERFRVRQLIISSLLPTTPKGAGRDHSSVDHYVRVPVILTTCRGDHKMLMSLIDLPARLIDLPAWPSSGKDLKRTNNRDTQQLPKRLKPLMQHTLGAHVPHPTIAPSRSTGS